MRRYLQIRSSRYQLLIPADGVREVLDLSEENSSAGESHGCRLWRGSSIRVVNLLKVLTGGVGSAGAALVYGNDESDQPFMLLCDEVVGLIQAADEVFKPLPQLDERVSLYFDCILPDNASGRMLLRLACDHLANMSEV